MTFRTFLALTLAVLPALSMVPAAAPAAEDPAAVADVEAQEQEPVGANDIRPSEPETLPSDDQVTGTAVVVGEEPQ
ncbi:MAG TPA: hypothetical protein PLY68_00215, partial [Myxococcota bacterium]|nr:hypothetical protein [Myxococcota bacterium]